MNKDKMKGKLITEPIKLEQIGDATDKNSEYKLVYKPSLKGEGEEVFWSKRMGSSVILFDYINKQLTVGVAVPDELFKIVFESSKNGSKHDLKWTQWRKAVENNEVNSGKEILVSVYNDGIVRVIPNDDRSMQSFYTRLTMGAKNTDEVKGIFRIFGVHPISDTRDNTFAH